MSTQYHVYANGGSGPIDYSSPIATVSGTTYTTAAMAANSTWKYGVRAFDTSSSLEETNVDARVTIALDGSKNDLALRPQSPRLVTLIPQASGAMRVHWAQPCRSPMPTGFHVYAGVGTPNYSSPAATVSMSSKSSFMANLTGYSDGAIVAVTVRAYNAAGEESNTLVTTNVAVATAPSSVEALTSTSTSGIVPGILTGGP